jgi:hypothetical protein
VYLHTNETVLNRLNFGCAGCSDDALSILD